ncbi:MAG: ElyC/SanA/YdcF family protein [Sulfuricurvum sp.]|uniref:ElyC/SanA/YdcF family protein n=1 Tax=Sulfuricurvum sp. TaxID=2025608 RepID=UPI00271E04F6|nr:ElyC/SanA/YdcF family protein [Sulfuricurvum sp.]MDO9054960.1 ElyC/SanA/YdcF family protein [Sulfuricurvum sp.]
MFVIKKAISSVLMPFPLFFIAIGIGIYLWYRGYYSRAKKIFLFAFAWITLLSYPPFSALLLQPLENAYPKVNLTSVHPHYIHVLGNGHTTNPNLPLSSELALVSLARINEGVTLYKSYPNMKLIFSGYGGDDPISNARKNTQMAIVLGVDPKDIITLESPRDTQDEAIAVKKIVGKEPLILVTSASHMVRASLLFRKNDINIIEAPTDFQVKKEDTLWQFPSSYGLSRSEAAFHEYLGLLWGKLKGSL